MNNNRLVILTLILSLGAFAGCGKQASDGSSYDTTTAEVMGESVSGAAAASDSGGSVVSFNQRSGSTHSWKQTIESIAQQTFEPKAFAAACSANVLVEGQTCNGASMTLNLGGCTGLAGVWTGSFTLTFDSDAACQAASTSGLLSMGANSSVTLTSPGDVTLTGFSGFSVETDSNSSGFSMPESGGFTITCSASGCNDRTLNILGLHRALLTPTSRELFDHTISTPTALSVTGTGVSKQITAGTVQLQHNLAMYVATGQIVQPLTFSANCCHPTGGQITITYSNGRTGSETVTFGPSCGVASVNGNSFSLLYCQ